jgi:hypothetical protein
MHGKDGCYSIMSSARRARAAHLTVLLCFAHCCRAVGTAAVTAYCFWSILKEGVPSMRIHIDKNQFDGNAIALVVIGLLIVIALAY